GVVAAGVSATTAGVPLGVGEEPAGHAIHAPASTAAAAAAVAKAPIVRRRMGRRGCTSGVVAEAIFGATGVATETPGG
ncbi:hypothetical protein, partial [Deinococcus sp. GbtcB9]|uniref:hypothetical protein n=1 Tax=Deinococcus sp. GbtcB9 TaxID=2824754 RepID=UPI001C30401F